MPIYEYRCKKCKIRFEEIKNKYNEKGICPKCKNEAEIIPSISSFRILGFNSQNNYGLK